MNYTFNGKEPQIDESAFIAPGVHIIGDVKIGKESSIWFNSVLRGDEGPITIGDRCNVQDNCTLHLYEQYPLFLEDEVSIGHNVILHGCTVRKGALIGMGATILDGAEIGEQAFIGANTLIPPGKKIPPRTMVMGSPGQVIRELNDKDLEIIRITIETYQQKGQQFKQELK
ncbi:gamma carbonic anhydrase family protein [Fictibacillus sp. FJAT-27399]|uniref:gamma carbonic anhydrase family protein n=1 Tax=Fictibacillus sp. FJAT-27399 TaxID=1729689 RepID=UPI000785B586|nr:gamma carbonic anhydrase family protein [Fictibacillus sp. FJAT-27399]